MENYDKIPFMKANCEQFVRENGYEVKENCLIELHLHLDGSVSAGSARILSEMAGIKIPDDDKALKSSLVCPRNCGSLESYLDCFALPVSLLQKSECISFAVRKLCDELRTVGCIYAEIRFAPQKHCHDGLSQEEAVEAAISGLASSQIKARLILCCMRDPSNEKANFTTLELAEKYLNKGVCACDLAGNEKAFPNSLFEHLFAFASAEGLPFTIHAGEAAGAGSVESAVRMGASRIGHGIRAVEDPELVKMLAAKNIPLEICPTSNLNTGVYHEISSMPLPDLIRAGVTVTVNSDNMSVSDTDVRKELNKISKAFSLKQKDIKKLLLNSANAAFLPLQEKSELVSEINRCMPPAD